MPSRAAELIAALELRPHPEGGYFRRIFSSAQQVQPQDGRAARPALTAIYYLLARGQHSRWHRVRSDEAWHFYEGEPLELVWIEGVAVQRAKLAAGVPAARPVCVVPAGCWQAARPLGEYALAGCTVGPGFDFRDFELLTPASPEWARIRELPGDLAELV